MTLLFPWICRFNWGIGSNSKHKISIKACYAIKDFSKPLIGVVLKALNTLMGLETDRLLHSPSLVAIGLSVGYDETWPPIGWNLPFVIGWSKERFGLPSAPLHYGLTWPVGIPTVFQTPVTVPLHCLNGRQLPAVRAVQRDCERV